MSPTTSSTSAPWVTREAAPRPDQLVHALGLGLVTGPGTPIRWRLSRVAQVAVLRAPLRTAASTTTVPRVSAAISRLRLRNRPRVGAQPGGTSRAPAPSRRGGRAASVGGRVGAVDPAGQHRDVGAVDRERAAVGGLVDAERRTGDDRVSGPDQAAGDAGRDLGAVGGRRTRADDRHGPGQRVEPTRPPHPEPQRWTATLVDEAGGSRSSSWRGHSASPGTTKRMPRRAARSRSPRRVELAQPGRPSRARRRIAGRRPLQLGQHLRSAERGHQPGDPRVSGLRQSPERDPRQPVVVASPAPPPGARGRVLRPAHDARLSACSTRGPRCGAGAPCRRRPRRASRRRGRRRRSRPAGGRGRPRAGSAARGRGRRRAGAERPRAVATRRGAGRWAPGS